MVAMPTQPEGLPRTPSPPLRWTRLPKREALELKPPPYEPGQIRQSQRRKAVLMPKGDGKKIGAWFQRAYAGCASVYTAMRRKTANHLRTLLGCDMHEVCLEKRVTRLPFAAQALAA